MILKAFIEWGEQAVDHLNGIFAFAVSRFFLIIFFLFLTLIISHVWSSKAKTLYLTRDHLGVKPLFYSFLPEKGLFVFGSEIKAILQHPDIEPIVTINGLRYVFMHFITPLHHTPYQNIFSLEPGHAIKVTFHFFNFLIFFFNFIN